MLENAINAFFAENQRILFRMPNDTTTTISNSNSCQIYEEKSENLIRSAQLVRKQPLFGNVDPVTLAERYPFHPFAYQIENVKTMLNRFEGRGVFGDQVGLGKTVEALMTAHAMFESGAIRNALIVVPTKTLDAWKNEIEHKFPNIFSICMPGDIPDSGDKFGTMLEKINEDNNQGGMEKRLYLITDGMLNFNINQIYLEENQEEYNRNVQRDFINEKPYFARIAKKMEQEIAKLNPQDRRCDPRRILDKFGWNNRKNNNIEEKKSPPTLFCPPTIPICTFTIDVLNELKERFAQNFKKRSDPRSSLVMKKIEQLIGEVQEEKRELEESIIQTSTRPKLFESGGDRLIDLMIVDEVHSFYEKEQEGTIVTDADSRRNAVDILARINKKFCVLMSATPVRTRLEDVFDLLYIADKDRFGGTREKAEDYFYRTVCGLKNPKTAHKLSEMIEVENRSNFFGLINNFFTRKRISDVSDDMKGSSDVLFRDMTDEQRKFIDAHSNRIIENRKLIYKQTGCHDETINENQSKKDFENWKKNGMKGDNSDSVRHMRAAIDTVLIELANGDIRESAGEEIAIRRMAHSLADWRRRDKHGMMVDISSRCERAEDRIVETALEAVESAQRYYLALDNESDTAKLEEIFSKVYCENINTLSNDAKADKLFKLFRGYDLALENDAIAYYIGIDDSELLMTMVMNALQNKYRSTRNVTQNPSIDSNDIGVVVENEIAIVHQGYQAGVNMQQYRTLIFVHMDWRGARLMEPVDVEQWIGRIHRTGQVRTSRIITLPVSYINGADISPDFLKWYYTILSDSEGLDLYGNNTPDIAFLQPVIVDIVRKDLVDMLDKKIIYNTISKMTQPGCKNTGSLEHFSFSQLAEFCYMCNYAPRDDITPRDYFRQLIRGLCAIEGFGKSKNKNDVMQG